jgi:KDO2-lipid IV(A) lauroyltransferase
LRVQHLLEYIGARVGLFVVDHLPLPLLLASARRVADLGFLLLAERRRIAEESILLSGIVTDPAGVRRLARESFRHFALMAIESLRIGDILNASNWRERVDVDIPEETRRLLDDTRQGVILASGHLGNWEIAVQILSLFKPVVGVTKDMTNPWVSDLMKARRTRAGFRITPKRDVDMGRFVTALRGGEMLALLPDQHARRALGMPIELFGRRVSMHRSPALLHLVTRAPFCLGYCVRIAPLRYRLVALPPIRHRPSGDKERDVETVLRQFAAFLEDAVRRYPEQYLWAHRRWRDADRRVRG